MNGDPFAHKLTVVAAAHHARIGAADSIYMRGIDGDDDTPEFTWVLTIKAVLTNQRIFINFKL